MAFGRMCRKMMHDCGTPSLRLKSSSGRLERPTHRGKIAESTGSASPPNPTTPRRWGRNRLRKRWFSFATRFITVGTGDIIETGTPAGVGPTTGTYLKSGDV